MALECEAGVVHGMGFGSILQHLDMAEVAR